MIPGNKLGGAGLFISGAILVLSAGIPLITSNIPHDLSVDVCVLAVLVGLVCMAFGVLFFRYAPEKRP